MLPINSLYIILQPLQEDLHSAKSTSPSHPGIEKQDPNASPTFYRQDVSYRLTSIPQSSCIGYARRRVGRGGRVIFDRMYSEYDEDMCGQDLTSGLSDPTSMDSDPSPSLEEILSHIRSHRL